MVDASVLGLLAFPHRPTVVEGAFSGDAERNFGVWGEAEFVDGDVVFRDRAVDDVSSFLDLSDRCGYF